MDSIGACGAVPKIILDVGLPAIHKHRDILEWVEQLRNISQIREEASHEHKRHYNHRYQRHHHCDIFEQSRK
jgi:hypothetical protein